VLLLGHIGITVGIVRACGILASRSKNDSTRQFNSSLKPGTGVKRERFRIGYWLDRIKSNVAPIDYRVVLLGSILPDIIDKPAWFLVTNVTGESLLAGRGYAHTLLFNLILLIGGLVLIRYRKPWLLVISLASFGHLIFDRMWDIPAALLWPLLGPIPAVKETAGWLSGVFQGLFSHVDITVTEMVGLVILLLLAYGLVRKKRVMTFIRYGAIS